MARESIWNKEGSDGRMQTSAGLIRGAKSEEAISLDRKKNSCRIREKTIGVSEGPPRRDENKSSVLQNKYMWYTNMCYKYLILG